MPGLRYPQNVFTGCAGPAPLRCPHPEVPHPRRLTEVLQQMRNEPPASHMPPPAAPSPRDVLRSFLHDWDSQHALLALNGHLTLPQALDDIALFATARGRFGVLVGPPEVRLPNFEVLPEDGLRNPADFLTDLGDVLVRRARVRAEPLLVFAPGAGFVEPWVAIDQKLDGLHAVAPMRLCIAPQEGLARLGDGTVAELQTRHGASLAL